MINMRYYLAARRYQFYFQVEKTVFYEYTQRELCVLRLFYTEVFFLAN